MKFVDRLRSLGHATYEEYLASAQWQNFKVTYKRSGRSMVCAVCNARRIQLHHHTYVRLGCERIEDVTPLCRDHHIAVHEWIKQSGQNLVGNTQKAIIAIRGEFVPLQPLDYKASLTEIMQAIHALPATRKQLKTAKKLALNVVRRKTKDLRHLRGLLTTIQNYVTSLNKRLPIRDVTPSEAKPKRDKKTKKKWLRRSHRPRTESHQPSTMSVLKSLMVSPIRKPPKETP